MAPPGVGPVFPSLGPPRVLSLILEILFCSPAEASPSHFAVLQSHKNCDYEENSHICCE